MYHASVLKKLRQESGLTQQQVAKCLRVDHSTYADYEAGNTEPDREQLIDLACLFGVSLSELTDEPLH